MANPIVTITMTDGSVMKAELYPEVAPNTVNNFISLVKKGFYDGLVFHRVIRGFMIQGGDPQGTGMGGPGYSIIHRECYLWLEQWIRIVQDHSSLLCMKPHHIWMDSMLHLEK